MSNNKVTWEIITQTEDYSQMVRRAKIFGGWIVHSLTTSEDMNGAERLCESMVFVPDPKHEWVAIPDSRIENSE